MWGHSAVPNLPPPPPPPSGYGAPPAAQPAAQSGGQKNDVFVGNLAFNTTEEQLHNLFSEVGRVIKVRLVTDVDSGKPKGYAFVEFADPQAALSAIRNVNEADLNGRNIRVNFSNSSHLESLAGQLGMDITNNNKSTSTAPNNQQQPAGPAKLAGNSSVADAIKNMSKGEMYDVIKQLKQISEEDESQARRTLASHPQLPEAILFLMSQLDMVQTPTSTAGLLAVTGANALQPAAAPAAPSRVDPRRVDPRSNAPAVPQQAPAAVRVDPRARVDPRKRR